MVSKRPTVVSSIVIDNGQDCHTFDDLVWIEKEPETELTTVGKDCKDDETVDTSVITTLTSFDFNDSFDVDNDSITGGKDDQHAEFYFQDEFMLQQLQPSKNEFFAHQDDVTLARTNVVTPTTAVPVRKPLSPRVSTPEAISFEQPDVQGVTVSKERRSRTPSPSTTKRATLEKSLSFKAILIAILNCTPSMDDLDEATFEDVEQGTALAEGNYGDREKLNRFPYATRLG